MHVFTVKWMLSLSLQLWCMNTVSNLDKFVKVVAFLYCRKKCYKDNSCLFHCNIVNVLGNSLIPNIFTMSKIVPYPTVAICLVR